MECNCIENKTFQADIRHVYGNVLRLAIPLTLRTLEKVGDVIEATDTDFIPSSEYPVTVEFSKGAIKLAFNAVMRDGNVAYIEDDGTIPVGVYAITVLCKDGNGRPYRFKQKSVLQVVEYTAEAGIEETIEYEVTTWYLDAAIFMALKGEDGVGVEDIVTESSGEIGGVNTVTIILTDGRTKEFTILNGSGSVDMVFDAESHHPVANSTVTAKFDEIDGELADLFGDVEYDSNGKTIKFYNKGKSRVLASLSAVPFVKDGMVNTVYISNNTLVITFNTDAGREAIGVPLTAVFNPNNYYNKTQVDNRIAAAVANVQIDTSTLLTKSEYTIEEHPQSSSISGRLKYLKIPPTALKYIEGVGMEDSLDGGDVFGRENGHIHEASYFGSTYDLGTVTDRAFLNKADGLFYRYIINEGWVQVGGSSSSGGDGSVVYGRRSSTGFKQGTLINGSWIYSTLDVDLDVKTIYFDVTTRKAYTWDGKDFQEFYSTSLANLADVAFSGSYNDLTDKPTIPEGADLTGYATETYVDNAIAGLVDTAPQTLDTLNELAQALGDDPNFATTISTQLGGKVDKETGKSLMTDAERTKLAGIASGAEVNVQADWNQTNSSADDYIKNKPTIPAAQVQSDWNATSGMGVILNKPTIPVVPTNVSSFTNDAGYLTEHQSLSGYATTSAMNTALAGKQDTISDLATIRSGASAGATALQPSDVSVETPATPDGTVGINVGSNTYTINLNHTHEGMAKLVVDTAANLPDVEDMEGDTIYGEVEDGEISVLYVGGIPFYGGGGGGTSGPVLRRPSDGSTIDFGYTENGSASKDINIKGKGLTQDLTVELSGTGYSFGSTQPSGVTRDSSTQLTVTAAAANTLAGVDIVVVYTGNAGGAEGALSITSTDNISVECSLIANSLDEYGLVAYWDGSDSPSSGAWVDKKNSIRFALSGTATNTSDGYQLNNLSAQKAAYAIFDSSANTLLNQLVDKEFTCIVDCRVKFSATGKDARIIDFGAMGNSVSGLSAQARLYQDGNIASQCKVNGSASTGFAERVSPSTGATALAINQYHDIRVKIGAKILANGKQEVYAEYSGAKSYGVINTPVTVNFNGVDSDHSAAVLGLGYTQSQYVDQFAPNAFADVIYKRILIFNVAK